MIPYQRAKDALVHATNANQARPFHVYERHPFHAAKAAHHHLVFLFCSLLMICEQMESFQYQHEGNIMIKQWWVLTLSTK